MKLQNPVGKVPPNIIFFAQTNKLTVWLCPTRHTSHLTQHTSHGALIFIDSILQDKNPCVTDATLIVTDAT